MEWTDECKEVPAICPEGIYRARLTEIRDVKTSTGFAVRLMFVVYLDDGSEIGKVSGLANSSMALSSATTSTSLVVRWRKPIAIKAEPPQTTKRTGSV